MTPASNHVLLTGGAGFIGSHPRKPFSAVVCSSILADTGVLIDPENIEGFADAMCTLLADSEYARKLGRAAHKRCRERFDWQVVAQRWNSLLQSPDRTGAELDRHAS